MQPRHQRLLGAVKKMYLKDGVLLRKFHCTESNVFYPQILLPYAYRYPVMQQIHDGPVCGHLRAERTLAHLKNRYYWYNMKDDMNLWRRTCTSCAERVRPLKTPRQQWVQYVLVPPWKELQSI